MNRQLAKQYFERAEAAQEAGKPEEALTLLNQLDAAFPNTKNIGVARAKAYAALGKIPEAVKLCDELVDRHDSRRARELKEQLLKGLLEPGAPQPADTPTIPARQRFGAVLKWAAVVCLLATIAWSGHRVWSKMAAFSDDQHAESPAVPNARTTQPPPPLEPGKIHPAFTWERDESGVPIWKSGIFRRVPCIGEPKRTIDVYLPLAYDEKPEALFPGVIIQMPGGNPDFIDLEDWAERSEVILIGVNTSRNGTFAQNQIAQDRALETIAPSMRLDQRMGFAIGMSGGGRASWQVACRYPENFRGIVMMGISGDEDIYMPPLYVRIAIIHGETDFNNKSTARALKYLKQEGYEVREVVVPGGHVTGPPSVRVQMLDWMVSSARRELGLPQPSR